MPVARAPESQDNLTIHSTRTRAAESLTSAPVLSRTKSWNFPVLVGAAMVVASPAARVMSAPSSKVLVPSGASQTTLKGSPELRIGSEVLSPELTKTLAGKTYSGRDTSSLLKRCMYSASKPEFTQVVYCARGQTLSGTAIGASMVLLGGLMPILFTVA
jgi:hypothetical protein